MKMYKRLGTFDDLKDMFSLVDIDILVCNHCGELVHNCPVCVLQHEHKNAIKYESHIICFDLNKPKCRITSSDQKQNTEIYFYYIWN